MKKIKFEGKLSLNKETISKLSDEQMNAVNGGSTSAYTCCAPGSWNHSSCSGDVCGSNTCPAQTAACPSGSCGGN